MRWARERVELKRIKDIRINTQKTNKLKDFESTLTHTLAPKSKTALPKNRGGENNERSNSVKLQSPCEG